MDIKQKLSGVAPIQNGDLKKCKDLNAEQWLLQLLCLSYLKNSCIYCIIFMSYYRFKIRCYWVGFGNNLKPCSAQQQSGPSVMPPGVLLFAKPIQRAPLKPLIVYPLTMRLQLSTVWRQCTGEFHACSCGQALYNNTHFTLIKIITQSFSLIICSDN